MTNYKFYAKNKIQKLILFFFEQFSEFISIKNSCVLFNVKYLCNIANGFLLQLQNVNENLEKNMKKSTIDYFKEKKKLTINVFEFVIFFLFEE